MRNIVLNYDEPPRFKVKLNKLAGTTNQVIWRLNRNEQTGIYSAVDLTGYSAECQLKVKNANDCEFGTNAEFLNNFVLVSGNVSLKTSPMQTVNNAFGFRLNINRILSETFTWDRAAGVVFIVSPLGAKEPFYVLEIENVPLAECVC